MVVFPQCLGWDGSVADGAATAFAAMLYDRLEGRNDLADAVAAARRELLNAAEETKRRDWHLARVWLGPAGRRGDCRGQYSPPHDADDARPEGVFGQEASGAGGIT